MKPRNQELRLPKLRAELAFAPDTLDAESRTVDLRWYTGAKIDRYSLFDGPYKLAFDLLGADLRRLNNGAPLLNAHNDYTLSDVIGVVESARIEGGEGRATVRFSEREDVEPIFRDVQAGILRNVSMGAVIHELEDVTPKGAETKEYMATSWEPQEISLVPIGADPGAQALAEGGERFPCQLKGAAAPMEATMKVRLLATNEIVEITPEEFDEKLHSQQLEVPTPQPVATTANPKAEERALEDAIERDKRLREQLRRAAAHYEMDELWVERHVKLQSKIGDAIEDALKIRAKRAPKTDEIDGRIVVRDDYESSRHRMEAMAEALSARGARREPHESAREYATASFVECAYQCLEWARLHRGLHPRKDQAKIIELALHSTSDYPLLLANTLNKTLMPAYENANPTYRMIASQRSFNDFRAHNFLRAGDFPVPVQTNEHGEFQYGTMSENREQVTLLTYGRIIGFTRQALVNDDVGAFDELARLAGVRAADFENATFYSICITAGSGLGPNLSDAVAVYDATHGNLTAAGALSNALLEEAYGDLMSQTGLDGVKLNVPPRYLLVAPHSYGLARRLTVPTNPNAAGDINTFAGQIEVISDANLTGTRFYVLADPARLPQYVYGFLGGAAGPRTEVRQGFEIDGVEFKLALDFGCGALDYRGGVSGAGA